MNLRIDPTEPCSPKPEITDEQRLIREKLLDDIVTSFIYTDMVGHCNMISECTNCDYFTRDYNGDNCCVIVNDMDSLDNVEIPSLKILFKKLIKVVEESDY